MIKDVSKGLDPTKNPSPWGALSEPPPEVAEKMMARSKAIASCFVKVRESTAGSR